MRTLQGRSGEIPRSRSRTAVRGFGLLELLVVMAVILLLGALLFPGLKAMQHRAISIQCVSNLKQISEASANYSSDHNGDWPPNQVGDLVNGIPTEIFASYLIPYLGSVPTRVSGNYAKSPLVCPGDHSDYPENSNTHQGIYTPVGAGYTAYGLSYAQNSTLRALPGPKRMAFDRPASLIAYLDFHGHYEAYRTRILSPPDRRRRMMERHGGILNAAFADGSVRSLPMEDVMDDEISRTFWTGK